MDQLKQQVEACKLCSISKTRTQAVFGSGNKKADIMIVAEAPGVQEDKQGIPLVGRSGQLLNNYLAALGIRRDDIYVCNVLKCRPPENRDPDPKEVERCIGYLHRQIELVSPKVIITLGKFAGNAVLGKELSMGKLRSVNGKAGNATVVPTWHPAYVLRSPNAGDSMYEDLKKAVELIK
jgi:DNA polymerase